MNATPFLITGLPRSRTAWLSVLCSTGQAICYHEPIGGMRDISDIEALYKSEFYKFVGISDSTLGFFLPWILKNVKPRTVIIERDMKEVMQSLFEIGLPRSNLVELLMDRLREFKDHPLVMWVPFEALKTKRVVQKIFWHLMPNSAFDEMRYEQLEKMRIAVDVKTIFAEAKRHKDNLDSLLRDIIPLIKLKANPNAQNIH